MSRTLPLSTTIDGLSLKGFGNDATYTAGSISGYDGGPLYCHVAPATGGVAITIDQNSPSTFTSTTGDVVSVTLSYQVNEPPMPASTITWSSVPSGNAYSGLPLEFNLVFSTDLSTATLQVVKPSAGRTTENSIGIVIVGSAITGGSPQGYFVDVPVGDGTVDVTNFSSIGVSWAPGGSFAGPIGGATLP